VLCSYRNVLAAFSLPNKVYNSICSRIWSDSGRGKFRSGFVGSRLGGSGQVTPIGLGEVGLEK
jgi:hypothetical protein